jgi:hypothetical protein
VKKEQLYETGAKVVLDNYFKGSLSRFITKGVTLLLKTKKSFRRVVSRIRMGSLEIRNGNDLSLERFVSTGVSLQSSTIH